MNYAVIRNGIVMNIVAADASFAATQGWREAPDGLAIGDTFDGQAFGPGDISLRKAQMRAAVTAEKLRREGTTAPTHQGRVQSDTDSRNKLNGAVLMAMLAAQGGQPFEIAWTMADNTNVTFDGPGLIAMASAVGQYVAACHAHGQALKTAIDAAADHAALDAIDIGAGWP